MTIERRFVNGIVILDLKGKMTLGEGDEDLKDMIRQALKEGNYKIVISFKEVPYIDSAGLGEVWRSYSEVVQRGGELKLCHVNERIRGLLTIVKLLTVFEIFDNEAAALDSYNPDCEDT